MNYNLVELRVDRHVFCVNNGIRDYRLICIVRILKGIENVQIDACFELEGEIPKTISNSIVVEFQGLKIVGD